jgi:hypothetical protein
MRELKPVFDFRIKSRKIHSFFEIVPALVIIKHTAYQIITHETCDPSGGTGSP